MNLKDFLKDKLLTIILLLFGILTIEIFLTIYPIGTFIKIYIPVVIVVMYLISIIKEYVTKRNFYKKIESTIESLEQKYLITELIKTPSFVEGKLLKNILTEINKSMIENVNRYKYITQDYKEYIELWIHEIKMPIATSKMIIENNKNNITKSIDEELDKVENYIEQVLYYARSSTVEKDYYIKKYKLKDIVSESIKKNKNLLIQEKANINLHDLDEYVNTDSKWLIFILNQIIQNSIKYRKKDKKLEIEIYSKKGKEKIKLYIKDKGIGIKKEEIKKIFEKGFTGSNGRNSNQKSTGIGLYLCKKLCKKLGIEIEAKSEEKEGTETKITIPQNSYINP